MRKGSSVFGTRVEVKNVNSFRYIEKAISFEIQRQIAVLSSGKSVHQETRLYDPHKDQTMVMRSKEVVSDYRYFPDPDLLPLVIPEDWITQEKERLPELPRKKRERYQRDFGLTSQEARLLSSEKGFSDFFEETLSFAKNPIFGAKTIVNLLAGEVLHLSRDSGKFIQESLLKPIHLSQLAELITNNTLSSTAAKKVLNLIWHQGGSVDFVIDREGLRQLNHIQEIEPIVSSVLAEHQDSAEELAAGKMKIMGFLVGAVMKRTGSRANPQIIQELIRKKLNISKKTE